MCVRVDGLDQGFSAGSSPPSDGRVSSPSRASVAPQLSQVLARRAKVQASEQGVELPVHNDRAVFLATSHAWRHKGSFVFSQLSGIFAPPG